MTVLAGWSGQPMMTCFCSQVVSAGRPATGSSRVEGAELRSWWHAAMDPKNNDPQTRPEHAGDGAVASAVEARMPMPTTGMLLT
jgi:hypothetical protein